MSVLDEVTKDLLSDEEGIKTFLMGEIKNGNLKVMVAATQGFPVRSITYNPKK